MGNGLPPGFCAHCPISCGQNQNVDSGSSDYSGGSLRSISGVHGRFIPIVERLLSFQRASPFSSTLDLADYLSSSLRKAAGDTWEECRQKVRAFIPDGAPDEQLAGQFASDEFPQMRCVLRCGVHAFVGAMKTGWSADPFVQQVTKMVVQ